ncbi:MAG: NHLP leader peptide family RiPP precursor [Streptococcaceae bacterium]|jgi:hypothetical protein|nr:NHLP leader peptide family RiPP precursor [Streptococcaceae bacterium]
MSWSQEEINEVYEKAMQKATTDEEFRQELLDDPKLAIEKLTEKSLPDDYTIKVVEDVDPNYTDPNYAATFVLPSSSAKELNFNDLNNVAGGNINVCGAQAGSVTKE